MAKRFIWAFFPFFCLVLAFCAYRPHDLGNVLRYPLIAKVKGFDPALSGDEYSHIAIKQVYETLLQYNHLKRPYQLEPLLAESLPAVSEDRLTYTFNLKNNIYFQPDPCFGGRRKKVTAYDAIFSIKRLADIKVRSTGWWLFDSKIKGLNQFREQSKTADFTDYDRPVSGLFASDSFTMVIELTEQCPQFIYFFAMVFTSVVPKEAVQYYGPEFLNHPVGSGPFRLVEWRRGLRLKYAANPDYRTSVYPAVGDPEDKAKGLLADAGKPLPFLDTLVLNVFVESQPMWLNFMRQFLDLTGIPKDNFNQVVTGNMQLKEEYADKGMVFSKHPSLDITYTCFNMEDSLLGRNVHLRRAMCYAWNVDRTIDLFYNGRAIPAHSPIPPGLPGYDSAFVNKYQAYDPALAKEELIKAGYPNGKGLPPFEYLTMDNTTSRQWAEKFVREMKAVGIPITVDYVTWPEYTERSRQKKYQIAGWGWGADYPDPENFLQLLYGPNESPGTNAANYKNPEYDRLYRRLLNTYNKNEKLRIIEQMKRIFVRDCPWIIGTHRLGTGLTYKWVKNRKYNDISSGEFKYYRIDVKQRNRYLERL